jgi:hypothetical protein
MRIKNATIKNAQVTAQYIVSGARFDISSLTSWAGASFNGTYNDAGKYIQFYNNGYLRTDGIDINTIPNNNYTYEFWVRTTGTDAGALLTKYGTGGYTVSAIEVSASTLVVGYWTGYSPEYVGVPTGITRDAWQHYTVTYDYSTTNLKTYYNGELAFTTNLSLEVAPRDYGNNPMFFDLFGYSPTSFGNGNALTGDLGEFRMYTRALNDAEVLQNYRATKSRWKATGLTSSDPSTSAWQIKQDYPDSTDGLYWIRNANINDGNAFQIYADMTTDGGGWTLLLQNANPTWTYNNSRLRNSTSPPSTLSGPYSGNDAANYSILDWADWIKRSPSGFEYMLEANARNSNGGIWTANEAYSFTGEMDLAAYASLGTGPYFGGTQYNTYGALAIISTGNGFRQNVTLTTKFGTWDYDNNGLEKRMPWFTTNNPGISGQGILTTSHDDSGSWWGTLMTYDASWQPAPWQAGQSQPQNPGVIWYWVR